MSNAGTAMSANVFAAIALASSPTVVDSLSPVGWQLGRLMQPSVVPFGSRSERRSRGPTANIFLTDSDTVPIVQTIRETTPIEHAIGELRRWSLLPANWDGEGAAAPITASVKEAVSFAGILPNPNDAEPMLHASGRAGLYFKTDRLYADIEFYGDSRVAYYIERNGDKHKGVVNFDSKTMPAVFEALLEA